MKVAIMLESPLLEAFALIGADYLHETVEDIEEDAGLVITKKEFEQELIKKYPEKIIIGV